jgi:hypothetical protein
MDEGANNFIIIKCFSLFRPRRHTCAGQDSEEIENKEIKDGIRRRGIMEEEKGRTKRRWSKVKVKLSLFLIKHYAMKTYGGVEVQLHRS